VTPQLDIRAYEPRDRDPVRRICFETGYMGEPIAWQWRDGESFADLATGYYTDREPESTLVAERDGRVVGYLTGCADSERSRGVAGQQVRQLLGRGALLRPGLAGVFWRSLFDLLRDRQAPDEFLADPRWPAHLHINLLPEGRRCGLGRRLVTGWLDRLRAAGSPGVHLGTFAENTNAIPFFEACGFHRHGGPARVPGLRTREGRRMHVQWMIRSL
jgi:ribosomal protein S18 acetylase RimI-like enzyme